MVSLSCRSRKVMNHCFDLCGFSCGSEEIKTSLTVSDTCVLSSLSCSFPDSPTGSPMPCRGALASCCPKPSSPLLCTVPHWGPAAQPGAVMPGRLGQGQPLPCGAPKLSAGPRCWQHGPRGKFPGKECWQRVGRGGTSWGDTVRCGAYRQFAETLL